MTNSFVAFVWPFFLGYIVVLVLGQTTIFVTFNILWGKLGYPKKIQPWSISALLGVVESILYVAALSADADTAKFIALWLGIKTVVKWRAWEADTLILGKSPTEPRWILGRHAYNLFLLGNALVVLFSAIGWQIIESGKAGELIQVYAIVAAGIIITILVPLVAHIGPVIPPLVDGDLGLLRNQPTAAAPSGDKAH